MNAPELRPYQASAADFVTVAHAKGENAVYFVLPTGSGKTHVLAELSSRYRARGRVLALVHRIELCSQIAERCAAFGMAAGIIAAGKVSHPERDIVVAIVDSMTPARLGAFLALGPISLVLVDESHHAVPGSRYASIIDSVRAANPAALFVGCTATPARADRKRMQDVLRRCVFSRDIEDLAALGVLAKPVGITLRLASLDLGYIRTSGGDYAQDALAQQMTRYVTSTVNESLPHLRGKLGLVFAANIAHAQRLTDAYCAAGIPAGLILGETRPDDRANRIAAWRERGHGMLINVGCLTEGFDEPRISVIVIACPTQSTTKYSQIIGRGLRLAPGKAECTIVDVMGRELDPRQVLLDSVLLHGPGNTLATEPGERNPMGARGRHRPQNAWLPFRHGWVLAIGNRHHWFVARDSDGSGLWSASLLEPRGIAEQYADLPLPELAEQIHRAVAANGPNPLTLRNALWRGDLASEKSIAYLRRFSPQQAEHATQKTWSQGRVSDAITIASVEQILRRLDREVA